MIQKENTTSTPTGFMLINKKPGPSSHMVVNGLRRITGIKKIGHAGTLDPFASGVLFMAIGRAATKEIDRFVKLDKKYRASLLLGVTSTSFDPEGEKTINTEAKEVSREFIEEVLKKFAGEQEQIPPMFSAKKVDGKRLYLLARKGIEIERKPSLINIFSLEIYSYKWPSLVLDVHCSSGTYIRTLASEIGEALLVGAYLVELERTAVGEFLIGKAVKLEELSKENWSEFLLQI